MKLCDMISFAASRQGFWIRIFGAGLVVSNTPPLFSERNGHTKVLRVLGWGIKYLPRGKA